MHKTYSIIDFHSYLVNNGHEKAAQHVADVINTSYKHRYFGIETDYLHHWSVQGAWGGDMRWKTIHTEIRNR